MIILFSAFVSFSDAFSNDEFEVLEQNPEEMGLNIKWSFMFEEILFLGGHFEGDMIFPEDYIVWLTNW